MNYGELAKQGSGWAIAVILAIVVKYQNSKIEKLYQEKDDLQERRLAGTKETEDKYNTTVGDVSQTIKLLLAKIDGKENK